MKTNTLWENRTGAIFEKKNVHYHKKNTLYLKIIIPKKELNLCSLCQLYQFFHRRFEIFLHASSNQYSKKRSEKSFHFYSMSKDSIFVRMNKIERTKRKFCAIGKILILSTSGELKGYFWSRSRLHLSFGTESKLSKNRSLFHIAIPRAPMLDI